MTDLNVYKGPTAVLDYLNSENNAPTPLIELPVELNSFHSRKIRIFAKLMSATPLANIKSYPAFNMLYEAYRKGELKNIEGIVESSSGNTALSLTLIAKALGIKKTKVLVSDSVPLDKLQLLQFFGAEIQLNSEPLCPDRDDPESGINIAKQMAKTGKWFNPGQYDNEDNPNAHYKWTGKQILQQTKGKISVLSATLGTTGTISSVGKSLKEFNKNIQIIGAASSSDIDRLGPRTLGLLLEVGFKWREYVDAIQEVDSYDSLAKSLSLCRNGILAGPSAGFNLIGLEKWLQEKIDNNTIDNYRNEDGEIIAVFVCPDGPFPYINTYLDKLDKSHFPEIENLYLIENPRRKLETMAGKKSFQQFEIESEATEKLLFNDSKQPLNNGFGLDKNYLAIDIRKESDYNKFRIPGIKYMPFDDLLNLTVEQLANFKKYKILVFNCGLSNGSKLATAFLQSKKINAYYVKGGMDLWTKNNFLYERLSK